jgi:PAS domain S-box-containing protein
MIFEPITISLIQNVAILLSFSMLYDYLWAKEENARTLYEKILAGFIIAGIGFVLMNTTWTLGSGLVFDTRSILLSISGLFFGFIPTVIAMVILGIFRFFMGGDGMWMELGVVFSSGMIGIIWGNYRSSWQNEHRAWDLLGLGIVVHLVTLGCAFFLPSDSIFSTLRVIYIPVFFIYSPATMLLGLIMVKRAGNWSNKKALLETQSLYASLVEQMPAGVFRKNKEGRYDYVNKRFCALKGIVEQEILGKTPQELADYTDLKEAAGGFKDSPRQRTLVAQGAEHHASILKNGQPIEIEESYLQKDGSIEFFQVVKTPIYDIYGRIVGSQGMQFDITPHKRMEEALLQEQYLLNSFMDNTPDLIYFKDLNSRFVRNNKAHANSFGLSVTKEALGKTDFDFYTSEHAQKAYNDEQNIIKTGIPIINIEERETWTDGRISWAITSKFPLIDKDGVTIGTFGVSRDITIQKQLESELIASKNKAEENDHLKTSFLHNISHEIRTPMNAIIGFSGLFKEPDLTPENRIHFADIVIQSSNQLLSIIDDIVRIATIDAGQDTVRESEIQVNSLCQLAYEQFANQAKEKGIDFKFTVDLPDDEARVFSDETKLLQVISNLLVNAFKFTTQGHIYFGYKLKGDFLEFFIEDSGIGIPEEMHQEIFKRFRQVESALSRQFSGSGLGLSICKAYIELMGGDLWLTSKSGEGSIFYFTLQYHKGATEQLFYASKSASLPLLEDVKKQITLLVAEDEDFNFMLLREVLSPLNAKILRASNGIEAVEMVADNPDVDLVLMDIKMPMMDGYEASSVIKAFNPSLPIFALTAYSQEADKNKAFECGCSDFIVKPFDKDDLIAKIKLQLIRKK